MSYYYELGNYTVTDNSKISYDIITIPLPLWLIVFYWFLVTVMVVLCFMDIWRTYQKRRERDERVAMGYQPFSSDTKNEVQRMVGPDTPDEVALDVLSAINEQSSNY